MWHRAQRWRQIGRYGVPLPDWKDAMAIWAWPNSSVTRVIDGDSLTARVTRDVGFHGSLTFDVRLRLNRINTPPVKTVAGKLAKAWLEHLAMSSPLLIETVGPYKYGDEWMAELTLPDGRNVADLMVSEGHAVLWDGAGPRPGG